MLTDAGALVREYEHVASPGLQVMLAPQRVHLRIGQAGTAADERVVVVLERRCVVDVTVALNGRAVP